MIDQSLSGDWQFRKAASPDWLPVLVPGCVHTDLMSAGSIPDPFIGQNEKNVQWVGETDWEYQRQFSLEPGLLDSDKVDLVCDGLDTIAEIWLNGQPVGQADNIHVQYRWPVKTLLQDGKNNLLILFRASLPWCREKQAARRLPTGVTPNIAHMRKVQSHFGWDWGPKLPTSGIWRDIRLEGHTTARIEDIRLEQEHGHSIVNLKVNAMVEQWREADLILRVNVSGPDGSHAASSAPVREMHAVLTASIQHPQLWWPNGMGRQPLYQVEVSLCSADQVLDQRTYQVGLRTISLRQKADKWGQAFTFVVNGVPFFARGADWIPVDAFINRFPDERLDHLIRSTAAANMNMLRVWGGGYYETERFYDLCDQYGILVWQDFAFACAPYPLDDPGFVENVKREVFQNVRRLRHRASLALWCGNNEIEMMWGLWHLAENDSLTRAYKRFFHQELPEWVRQVDPEHACWPSSPSSGEFLKDTNGDARGDTHLWAAWHGLKPFTYYRRRFTRFASEFGFEALPAMDTIAGFAVEKDFQLRSKVMLHHQRSVGGNEKMLYYLADRFRLPRDFKDLVYLTQVNQAEAMRYGIEHWRRNWPRCSGALFWQLNDCWPVASWASIDYEGRWKALQYISKRIYAPVAMSLEERGTQVGIHMTNDTLAEWSGDVRWSLETFAGQVVRSGREFAIIPPLAAACLKQLDLSETIDRRNRNTLVFVAELWQKDFHEDTQVVLFAPERDVLLPDPNLQVSVHLMQDSLLINLSAQNLARFVELYLPDGKTIFSDNYFDLPAGRIRRISYPLPEGMSIEQARQSLKVRSLYDVAPAGSKFSDQLVKIAISLQPQNLVNRILFSLIK